MFNIVSLVLTAKARFKALLDNKFNRQLKMQNPDMQTRVKEQHECLKIVDRIPVLKDLHLIAKVCLFKKMTTRRLDRGEKFQLRNFPCMDFTMIMRGRFRIKWYSLTSTESLEKSSV